jgi:hypothetical protein
MALLSVWTLVIRPEGGVFVQGSIENDSPASVFWEVNQLGTRRIWLGARDRRQRDVSVAVERRSGQDRRHQDRRGAGGGLPPA